MMIIEKEIKEVKERNPEENVWEFKQICNC